MVRILPAHILGNRSAMRWDGCERTGPRAVKGSIGGKLYGVIQYNGLDPAFLHLRYGPTTISKLSHPW